MVLVVFGLIWGNVYYRQYKYFHEAERYKSQDRPLDAIASYECAIRMYTPGSSLVKQSIENIWRYGQTFEQERRIEEAIIAYRALTCSLYAVRSFYSPYQDWRTRAEQKAQELVGLLNEASVGSTPGPEVTGPPGGSPE